MSGPSITPFPTAQPSGTLNPESPETPASTEPPKGQKPEGVGWSNRIGLALFAVGAIGACGYLMYLGRGLTFFYDEWNFIDTRGMSFWTTDLRPHNGHPVVIPYAVYRVALSTFGLHQYAPYRLMVVAIDIICGWLLFVLIRRKLHPAIAAAAATVLMVLGPAWQDLLWPFQIGFLGSVAFGLGALVLLERNRNSGDVGISVCLIGSVFCSAVGLTMLVGIGVELVWRKSDRRRLWVVLPACLLFALWYVLRARGSSTVVSTTMTGVARYIANAAIAAVGALIGRPTPESTVITILLALLVMWAFARRPADAGRLAMATVGALSFWILTMFTRGQDPDASRYLYPGVVFVLLAVGELPHLLAGRRAEHRRGSHLCSRRSLIDSSLAVVIIVGYASAVIWWNTGVLRQGQEGLLLDSRFVRAELTAVQLMGHQLPSSFQPDPQRMPQVSVGPYLAAVAAYGSPALPTGSLHHQPLAVNMALDTLLLRGLPMKMHPVRSGSTPTQTCVQNRLMGTTVITLPASGVWISAPKGDPTMVSIRAFSPRYTTVPGSPISGGQTVHLAWSGTNAAIRWYVQVSGSGQPSLNCATPPS